MLILIFETYITTVGPDFHHGVSYQQVTAIRRAWIVPRYIAEEACSAVSSRIVRHFSILLPVRSHAWRWRAHS